MTFGILASAHVPFSGGATGYAAEVLADSPLAYWRLGESSGTTAADSSGNGRSGTYAGEDENLPDLGVTGLITDADTAMEVDLGPSANRFERVDVADAAWQSVSNITVEAWIQTTRSVYPSSILTRWDNTTSANCYWLLDMNTGGVLRFAYRDSGNTSRIAQSSGSINDGDPHHVVATYDGSTIRLYIDGSADGTLSTANAMKTGTGSAGVCIAARLSTGVGGAGTGMTAIIDEVAIYDSALSAARISAHYSAGTA